jgi:hypothetical protein
MEALVALGESGLGGIPFLTGWAKGLMACPAIWWRAESLAELVRALGGVQPCIDGIAEGLKGFFDAWRSFFG